MKALLLSSPGTLEVADVDTPSPEADEVRVRIVACGICGSDVHGFTGSTGRRIPPLVMGH
jgi:L-iditol 2-dehydrogenase